MDKEYIKQLYLEGKTMREIGKIYGINRHKISHILKEQNVDTSKHEKLEGQIFINSQKLKYKVIRDFIENGHGMVEVEFLDSGFRTIAFSNNAKRGIIKDYFEKSIYSVACKGKISCPKGTLQSLAFHRWGAMISRCYNPQDTSYHNYGKRGVKVSEEWLMFENFWNDLSNIKGYDEKLYQSNKLELDKDICGNGLLYSKQTCCFVNKMINIHYQRRNYKPFEVTAPNGEKYIYYNQTICGKELNLIPRSIGKCLHGELNHTGGYKFKYLES